jgi:hypothetical protein
MSTYFRFGGTELPVSVLLSSTASRTVCPGCVSLSEKARSGRSCWPLTRASRIPTYASHSSSEGSWKIRLWTQETSCLGSPLCDATVARNPDMHACRHSESSCRDFKPQDESSAAGKSNCILPSNSRQKKWNVSWPRKTSVRSIAMTIRSSSSLS